MRAGGDSGVAENKNLWLHNCFGISVIDSCIHYEERAVTVNRSNNKRSEKNTVASQQPVAWLLCTSSLTTAKEKFLMADLEFVSATWELIFKKLPFTLP